MTDPYLVPCLVTLRAEFNALNPLRDKGSDGWIGDVEHQGHSSDHNPDSRGRVLALDIDSTGPWPAPFTNIVESLRGDSRLEYIIWNRRIASRDQGWRWRTYTGTSDPHTGHAHFSARHDHTGNTSTAPWHLEDFMAIDNNDVRKIWMTDGIIAAPAGSKNSDGTPNQYWSPAYFLQYGFAVLANVQRAVDGIPDASARAVLAELADPSQSDEDVAASLRKALGDRAAAVGRLLAE
jgi:hypothetical protein